MILQLQNVSKKINETSIIEDISLEIEKGEVICIVGPSGCGKTTLLRILSGLIQISSGYLKSEVRKIGYVFQEDRLLPWRTVYDNIKLVNKEASKISCLNLINSVKLNGFEEILPDKLSGGMRQRCSIARAFFYNAELLLMDEPLKSLDYILRNQMIKYIVKLWENSKTAIVFVTHEIDEALLLGDQVLVLTKRPTKILKKFKLTQKKSTRSITDPVLVEMRGEIITLLNGEY
jgi:NitT/TauT family transport system ATP-binding protein